MPLIWGIIIALALVSAAKWINSWWLRRAHIRELEAVAYMRTPPKFASETPGDRRVAERAAEFVRLLIESGNKWFAPTDVKVYTYQGSNGKPGDNSGYGLTFEAWQEMIEQDYRAFKAAWMEGKGRQGQQMTPEARALFDNQRAVVHEWGEVRYNGKGK